MTVDQMLQKARDAHRIKAVLWERRTRYAVVDIPVLDSGVDVFWATQDLDFLVVDDHKVVQYIPFSAIAEQDLPKVAPGAVLWEVESLEDNECGTRQHCWRWLFEETA